MATFTNFLPLLDQTDVARTTGVNFTIAVDAYGVQIGTLNASISGVAAIQAGAFANGYNGRIFAGLGKYVVGIYPKAPNFLPAAAKIDISLNVHDTYDNIDSCEYSFYTVGYNPAPPVPPAPQEESRACSKIKPFFTPTDLGLRAAWDSGTGTEVILKWKQAYPYKDSDIIYYNVYFASERETVLDHPEFMVEANEITIGGFAPGDMNFFAVRSAEFNPVNFTTDGMIQAGPDMFFYPETATDGYVGPEDMTIPVQSVDGFPQYGIAQIGYELIRYGSIQHLLPPSFVVSSHGRGYMGTPAQAHQIDSAVILYKGREDNNSGIIRAVPTFQKPNYALTWVKMDGYGPDGYRAGFDGYDYADGYDGYFLYNQEPIDSNTTDGTSNDASGDFRRFDYCGSWRQYSPASFMQGQCTRSYFGGTQLRDGYRVRASNAMDQMLQREELLLETTGEPFVLLRRMWTGMRCLCFMNRREHPDARCPLCFGTGFTQGFIQFFNPRRSDRRILVRVDPAEDDLIIIDRGGLEPLYEPSAWTLPFPQLKDRDLLVRFNLNNTEEFRYEVLNVTRNRALFVQTGAQKFKMKRLVKTDMAYQFPVMRDTRPYPGSISTSVSVGPGMKLHSHLLVIPAGINYGTLKEATQESEGHNHIIYNGVVQPVLGHTHTLPLL
jgi:hypothetical protein